jgi:hypothetical protein
MVDMAATAEAYQIIAGARKLSATGFDPDPDRVRSLTEDNSTSAAASRIRTRLLTLDVFPVRGTSGCLRRLTPYPSVETPLKDRASRKSTWWSRAKTPAVSTPLGGVTKRGTPIKVACQVTTYSPPVAQSRVRSWQRVPLIRETDPFDRVIGYVRFRRPVPSVARTDSFCCGE